jgi:hypothetical protein
MTRRWFYGLGLPIAAIFGCSGGDDGVPRGCEPAAEDVSQTPRADQNLELFALAHSDGIVADQDVYDRIVRDVTSMRELEPLVANIDYFARYGANTLRLQVSADTLNRMEHGDYSAWDCLNSTYRVTDIDFELFTIINRNDAILTFAGVYDYERLGALYAILPEILSSQPAILLGDGPTICLTTSPDTWHYVFDRAGGDCPAGCTEHDYYHFASSSDGTVEQLESWHFDYEATAPSWVAQYASREACR